jgi:hypothetical protein
MANNIISIECPNLKELLGDFQKVGDEVPRRIMLGVSQFLSMVADAPDIVDSLEELNNYYDINEGVISFASEYCKDDKLLDSWINQETQRIKVSVDKLKENYSKKQPKTKEVK